MPREPKPKPSYPKPEARPPSQKVQQDTQDGWHGTAANSDILGTECATDRVREVLRPYVMLYLGELCRSYAATCEFAFMAQFRPGLCGDNTAKDLQHHHATQEIEMGEIERVIRDIGSVETEKQNKET